MRKDTETSRQEAEYVIPYHHLVSFDTFKHYEIAYSGLEYYGYMKDVLNLLESTPHDSLLDIGCGDGKMIYELKRRGSSSHLVGSDYSARAIHFARAFNYSNNSKWYDCDAVDIEGQFDIVTAIETMEHVHDDDMPHFVDTVAKKLKPGGKYIVSVPTTNFPLHKKHYRHYTKAVLEEQIKKYFTVESVQYAVKAGWLEYLLLRINAKFATFKTVLLCTTWIAERFLFPATEKNGRHMIAVCKHKD